MLQQKGNKQGRVDDLVDRCEMVDRNKRMSHNSVKDKLCDDLSMLWWGSNIYKVIFFSDDRDHDLHNSSVGDIKRIIFHINRDTNIALASLYKMFIVKILFC